MAEFQSTILKLNPRGSIWVGSAFALLAIGACVVIGFAPTRSAPAWMLEHAWNFPVGILFVGMSIVTYLLWSSVRGLHRNVREFIPSADSTRTDQEFQRLTQIANSQRPALIRACLPGIIEQLKSRFDTVIYWALAGVYAIPVLGRFCSVPNFDLVQRSTSPVIAFEPYWLGLGLSAPLVLIYLYLFRVVGKILEKYRQIVSEILVFRDQTSQKAEEVQNAQAKTAAAPRKFGAKNGAGTVTTAIQYTVPVDEERKVSTHGAGVSSRFHASQPESLENHPSDYDSDEFDIPQNEVLDDRTRTVPGDDPPSVRPSSINVKQYDDDDDDDEAPIPR